MSFLTTQIGPLPGGAWLAVVVGGVGVGYLGRRSKASATAAATPTPATTAQDQSSQGAVTYYDPATMGTGTTSFGTPKPATNEEWASQAISYLVGRGAVGSRATNAVSHILYPDPANPTSAEDSALYNSAVGAIGPPPSLPTQSYIPDAPGVVHPVSLADQLATLVSTDPNAVPGSTGGSSGYYTPGETVTPGGSFDYIPSQPNAAAVLSSGQKLYYEPSPGVFVDAAGVPLNPGKYGTALYLKRV